MMALRRSGALLGHLTLLLAAAALFMRALIPGGWMPAANADGSIRIILCTGMGETAAWIDADGNVHTDTADTQDSQPKTDKPCTFAAFAPPLAPLTLLSLPALYFTALAVPLAGAPAVSIGRGLSAPPPPATGPPASL